MGLLRRFGVFMLLIIILIGLSGCMKDELPQQSTKEENKAKEAEMLAYLKDKYKREFTSIEYIPAKRGFNDGYNENVLITESNDGILVNTKEKLVHEGEYYDDYLNSYASKLAEGTINYSGIKNLRGAKTYITLKPDDNDLPNFLNGEFKLTNEKISIKFSIISISSQADEVILKDLYEVYQRMYSISDENNVFIVCFEGDKNKAEKYVNNFLLYGIEAGKYLMKL
jgi:hypothetical protein